MLCNIAIPWPNWQIFLTKPLQGQLFRTFRDVLLRIVEHINTLATSLVAPFKERVGGSVSVHHENDATGVLDTVSTGTAHCTANNKVTWADVQQQPSTTAASMCGGGGHDLQKQRKSVLRSFSQNNPVNSIKV